jgi:PilZ domain-containing protein
MHPDTSADKPVERRQSPRQRVLKGGVVAFNDRYVTLPCTVRDISDGGARLRIEGSITAPDTFELIIEIDGLEAACEVVSRRGNEVSVRFVSPPRKMPPRRLQVVNAIAPVTQPSLRKRPKLAPGA